MSELLQRYVDSSFIDALAGFAPLVFAGILLGAIVAVVGWVVGLVVHLGKFE